MGCSAAVQVASSSSMAVAACSTASLERRRARTEVTDQMLIFGQVE